MAVIDEALGVWLAETGRLRFEPGRHDCMLWPADWVLARRWVDPAAPYRGRYSSVLGYRRLLLREGGLLALASAGAARAGLKPTDAPKAGDVGVVRARTQRGIEPCGAIRTSSRWAVLSDNGLVSGPFPMLAAWEV